MSKLNKLVTNYPVSLTPEEVENLSLTLSAVQTAGSSTGDKTYQGDGTYIGVDNVNNTIRLLDDAAAKLNRAIPSAVSDLSDSANYATVESLSNYQPIGDYLSATDLNGYATEQYVQAASAEVTGWVNTQNYLTEVPEGYLTKTSADTLYQLSGDYYSASNPSGFIDGLTVLTYSSSTWADFTEAFAKNDVILCRISAGTTGYRHGFLAWIDGTPENPTQVQFQYYRNIQSHTTADQADQLFIYTLKPDNSWSLSTRTTNMKYLPGNGLSATANGNTMTFDVTGAYATSAGLTADTQYAMTTSGWEAITGGSSFTGVETTGAISGDGLVGSEIGLVGSATSALDMIGDQYQIDGSQYITVVPNTATKKVVIGLDNQVSNAVDTVTANANMWNNASAVSAKSHTTIDNTTNIITTENQGTSASLSAVEYKDNVNVAGMNVQQIYAVRNDGDIFACLSTTANKGTLFFVCSGIA